MTNPLTIQSNRLVKYPVMDPVEWLAGVKAMRNHDVLQEYYWQINEELIQRTRYHEIDQTAGAAGRSA